MLTKLITAVTTEPITVSDVLAQVRHNTYDLADSVTLVQSIAPGAHDVGSETGTSADLLGYKSLVLLEAGDCTSGTVDVVVQDSDDDTTYTTWSTFTQVDVDNDNTTYEKEYTGNKRYVKGVATIGTASCEFAVSVMKYAITSSESALITAKIQAAREYGEDYAKQALAPQTWEVYYDDFPSCDLIEWPYGPMTSCTSLIYIDSDGTETTMVADTDYIVDTDTYPGRVYLPYATHWPSFTPQPYNAVILKGVCGYTGAAPYILPHNFKEALLVHVGLMFRYRDEEIPEGALNTVHRLYKLRSYRWL